MKKVMLAAFFAATLSACQSNFTYVPIVGNPPNMEMAEAQCQMMSSSTQKGYIAYGSQSYVAGAAIGNAIGNAIAADQFVRQCMTMHGWRRVPIQPAKKQTVHAAQPTGLSPAQRKEAVDILAMGHIAESCKVKISAEKRTSLKALRDAVGPEIRAEGRALGEKTISDNAKNSSRAEVCKRADNIVNGTA